MANYSTTDPSSYFVPGFGISRAVIQSEIRYFCGPDAIVRPYTHHVCDPRSWQWQSWIDRYFREEMVFSSPLPDHHWQGCVRSKNRRDEL